MRARFIAVLLLVVSFTAAGLAQDQPLRFIMLADTQLGIYTANRDFVRETANYEFAVAAVNRLKPAFMIVLGDLINKDGDPSQIQEFQRITGKVDSAVPVYYVAGNHDVTASPTPESLAAYRKIFGRDYYSFRAGSVYGIVLDSSLIQAPAKASAEYEEQLSWLKAELEKARESDAKQIIVFQHHPYFMKEAQEPDDTWNIPLERRQAFLALLHQYNVHYVFAGHTHRNSVAKDADLEMTTQGPVSMPFGNDGSGIRLVEVNANSVNHRYYDFGKMPDRLAIK